jgi:hypothetical protein
MEGGRAGATAESRGREQKQTADGRAQNLPAGRGRRLRFGG